MAEPFGRQVLTLLLVVTGWIPGYGLSAPLTDPSRSLLHRDSVEKNETGKPTEGDPASRWVVTLIRIGMGQPSAIVNKRLVYPGDEVDGFKVTEIQGNEVKGTEGEVKRTLVLGSGKRSATLNIHPR
ncbi:MAG: hypothetical protein HQL94_00715 [Magnetococcales bacterium]|nr:hypothetical protein [Magnetococcales bacterium]MBF0438433.1 hypothetical protein [Magnetococcales bacterium]